MLLRACIIADRMISPFDWLDIDIRFSFHLRVIMM